MWLSCSISVPILTGRGHLKKLLEAFGFLRDTFMEGVIWSF